MLSSKMILKIYTSYSIVLLCLFSSINQSENSQLPNIQIVLSMVSCDPSLFRKNKFVFYWLILYRVSPKQPTSMNHAVCIKCYPIVMHKDQ